MLRKTKIVCTLGPSTDDENVMRSLIEEGMNVARFNFSHGGHEEQFGRLTMLRKLRGEMKRPVAALLDTKGPEIRLKEFASGKVELKNGQTFTLTTEDIVDGGSYGNNFRVPTGKYLDYMEYVQKYVAKTVKRLVEIVHASGKEAMMFLGDSWIGTEPYGKYFKEMELDAVVGSVGGGVTVRMLSEIPHVKYREGRLLPYFFPDTFYEGNEEAALKELDRNWRIFLLFLQILSVI